MIAVLLCACASFTSARRPTVAEAEANYKLFIKYFDLGNYDQAKAIADQKKVDRQQIIKVITTAMWQEVILTKVMGVGWAKAMARKFQLDRATETAFAQDVFSYLVINNSCEIAADVVLYFDLGPIYADKAINCAQPYPFPVHVARLACRVPGTKDLRSKLINGWVNNFQQSQPAQRDYVSMAEIAVLCPLTADQYADLFAIGLKDKQLEFTRIMLEKGNFKKILADYDNFIAMAVAQFQCGMAATVALKHKLPDATVEALFLNPKCFGGNLWEVDPALISSKKVYRFFELSLEAHEYLFARNLVEKFNLADTYFDRIVDEAIAAKDFSSIIDFDPPAGLDKRLYQDGVLEKLMDSNEEWFVVRYAISRSTTFSSDVDENWYAWIERAYLHALRRGAFELAAEIAYKYELTEFSKWGINLAFDGACQARNLDEAETIVRRYKLGREALNRVVLLRYQKNKEEKKKRMESRQRQKRVCGSSDDWNVKPCK